MSNHYYNPVGRCIYCGATELPPGADRFSDEHIIAFSFGGTLILPEASCPACQKLINRDIEHPILRQEWGWFRDKYDLPTYNKAARKKRKHIPVKRLDGGTLLVPTNLHSTPVPLYLFSEAAVLLGLPHGIGDKNWLLKIFSNPDHENAMQENFPAWDKTHSFRARHIEFARMIAKIGHGYAVAEYGRSDLETFEPMAVDVILGRSKDWSYLVGGSLEIAPVEPPGPSHRLTLKIIADGMARSLIVVEMRFFCQSLTPTYHAVVGAIDFKNDKHVATVQKHLADGKIEEIAPSIR
jgi:hypothetical protein